MKRTWISLLLLIFILLLGACGQGTNDTGSVPIDDGIESEENEDLTDSDVVENDEENENAEEQNGESEEQPSGSGEANRATMTIELVFPDEQVMDMYRVEREIDAATEEELIYAAFDAWIAGPTEEGLVSLLPDGVKVESVTDVDGVAHVSLSSEFLNAQVGSGTEEMLLQQIAIIMKQFGFDETQILIEGDVQDELFGHIDTSVPIVAKDLEQFEKYEEQSQ